MKIFLSILFQTICISGVFCQTETKDYTKFKYENEVLANNKKPFKGTESEIGNPVSPLENQKWALQDIESIFIGCTDWRSLDEFFIIKSNIEYKELKNLRVYYGDCLEYEYPHIDFSLYYLMGIRLSYGGCKPPDLDIEIDKNDSKREYTFVLSVKEIGPCRKLTKGAFYFLIPKLENDYGHQLKIQSIM